MASCNVRHLSTLCQAFTNKQADISGGCIVYIEGVDGAHINSAAAIKVEALHYCDKKLETKRICAHAKASPPKVPVKYIHIVVVRYFTYKRGHMRNPA